MKQKLKKLLTIGIVLFGMFLCLVNCQKDNDFKTSNQSQNKINSPFKISQIGKLEFETNPKIREKLTKLTESSIKGGDNLHNKTVFSSEHGFAINTNYANYIESSDGSYHSYTFNIMRTIETDSLENLVLSLQPDGSYKSLIVTYNITAQEKQDLKNGLIVDFTNKVSKYEINDIGLISNIFSKEIDCIEIVYAYCSYGNHDDGLLANGQNCPGYTEDSVANIGNCDSSGGGSSSSGDTGSGSNNNNNNNNTGNPNNNQTNTAGGNTSGNNDATTPTVCKLDCLSNIKTPCETLKNVTDSANMTQSLNALKTQTTTNIEAACEIVRSYNSNTQQYEYTPTMVMGENFKANPRVGGFIQGQAHNHPKDGLPIPSWGDIRWTYRCEIENATFNDNTAFNIVIVSNPELENSTITYAITIDNLAVLHQQIILEMNKPKVIKEPDLIDKLRIINTKFGEDFEGIEDDSSALEKKFLEVFYNYGISLYKKNDTTNSWGKLKLQNPYDPNTPNAANSVTNEPCIY